MKELNKRWQSAKEEEEKNELKLEMEEIKREIAVLTHHEKDVQPPSPFYGSFWFILLRKATQLEK